MKSANTDAHELSDEIIQAMKRWSAEHGRHADARVPFAALAVAMTNCLRQYPADQRTRIIEEFRASVLKQIAS